MSLDFTAPDQTFWLICAAFYLADSCVLHAPNQLILVERFWGGWRPAYPLTRYRLRQRLVTPLAATLPFLAATRSTWLDAAAQSAADARRTGRQLDLLRARLLPFRFLGAIVFANTFLAGPATTYAAGPGIALVIWAPLHLACVVALVILLSRHHQRWGLTWRAVAAQCFECTLAPGYFANVCRRLTLRMPPVFADIVSLVGDTDGAEAAGATFQRLALVAADLVDEGDLAPADQIAALAWQEQATDELAAHD